MRTEKKIRLNLELTPAVFERLDSLVEASGAQRRTEVIRRALTMYDLLVTKASHGQRTLILRSPNGKEEELLFVP